MDSFKLTPEEINALREKLPYGAMSKISKDLDLTRSYVSQVLNNLVPYNHKVIVKAIELAEQIKSNDKNLRERYNKLLSKSA